MAKRKTTETEETVAEEVISIDGRVEALRADFAEADEKVAKAKALVALAEPRLVHLAGVIDRIGDATPEKQEARLEEAAKMLKDLFKAPETAQE